MIYNENRKKWYQKNRYLEQSSHEDIKARLDDIMTNIGELNQSMLISPRSNRDESMYFMAIFQDLLQELEIRFGDPRVGITKIGGCNAEFPNPQCPIANKAKNFNTEARLQGKGGLFKFTKHEYAERLLKKGEIYFSPAALFDNDTLPSAIQDNEHTVSWSTPGKGVTIKKIGQDSNEIPIIGDLRTSKTSDYSYWISCFSASHGLRMYDAFKATQCVMIYKPKEFMRRVAESFYRMYDDRDLIFGGVKYIDPYLNDGNNTLIPFAKPLRYFYQSEVRYVVIPHKEIKGNIDPFTINIGSIEDIAETIIKNNPSP